MRFLLGGRVYRVKYRARFGAFLAVLLVLCVLAGYVLSGTPFRGRSPAKAVPAASGMNRMAIEMTGNR